MRVNFSVTNQLATPAIHAAALANRPPAGQPGRLFVDTDNPSSGIYRDTGTVWENITGGASAGNLQTVTDAGNTTDNNILLTYADNTLDNALFFYNDQLAQEEYLIEKRGTGITTNDSLAIQSRGNISPSTNPVGFLIDGANDIIKSFYTTSYTENGLKLDFANSFYSLGNSVDDFIKIDALNGSEFRSSQGSVISIFDGSIFTQLNIGSANIATVYNNNIIGLSLDFANAIYSIGWNNFSKGLIVNQSSSTIYLGDDAVSGTGAGIKIENDTDIYIGDYTQGFADGLTFSVTSSNNTIKTAFQGSDIGLKLEFNNNDYYFGNFGGAHLNVASYDDAIYVNAIQAVYIGDYFGAQNGTIFGVLDGSQTLDASANLLVGTSGSASGQHLKIRVGGNNYVIELKNP